MNSLLIWAEYNKVHEIEALGIVQIRREEKDRNTPLVSANRKIGTVKLFSSTIRIKRNLSQR